MESRLTCDLYLSTSHFPRCRRTLQPPQTFRGVGSLVQSDVRRSGWPLASLRSSSVVNQQVYFNDHQTEIDCLLFSRDELLQPWQRQDSLPPHLSLPLPPSRLLFSLMQQSYRSTPVISRSSIQVLGPFYACKALAQRSPGRGPLPVCGSFSTRLHRKNK